MAVEIGFDNEKYEMLQSEKIKNRIDQFGGKLYLEFGGKLFDDFHASRVLPGFRPDGKVNMLMKLKEQAEIVIVISANDIEKNKVRGDLGITYDLDVLRLIDAFRGIGLFVGSVVITHFSGQPAAKAFKKHLDSLGIKVYKHYPIAGYPSNLDVIASEEGYGKNEYIETSHPLVVVTAPGPGSGKMAVCLSQLYHDNKRKISSGYAKYETFPVWDLPLNHPVNIAYEAATADLGDVNMIDPFHLEAYEKTAVNYNRDIEIFPVLSAMLEKILGESPYKSPTDMGVNTISACISDNDVVEKAASQEIIRRYYNYKASVRKGIGGEEVVVKVELLMKQAHITLEQRPVVSTALEKEQQTEVPAVAIQLPDGQLITGKTSKLLGASSAALLNALKVLGGISDRLPLISKVIIEPIQDLKVNHLGGNNPRLHTDEILVALSICAATNPTADLAMQQLEKLSGSEAHSTVLLSQVDENVFRKLGVNLTQEPKYQTKKLYHGKR